MFTVPVGEWFRKSLSQYIQDVLFDSNSFVAQLFNPAVLHKMVNDHLSNTKDFTRELRILLAINLWHKSFFNHSY
jgi:asparagine synthase (glutamine-hydrolysing)